MHCISIRFWVLLHTAKQHFLFKIEPNLLWFKREGQSKCHFTWRMPCWLPIKLSHRCSNLIIHSLNELASSSIICKMQVSRLGHFNRITNLSEDIGCNWRLQGASPLCRAVSHQLHALTFPPHLDRCSHPQWLPQRPPRPPTVHPPHHQRERAPKHRCGHAAPWSKTLQWPCPRDKVKCLQCGSVGPCPASTTPSVFICHVALPSDQKLDSLMITWALTWLQISLCVLRVPALQPERPSPVWAMQPPHLCALASPSSHNGLLASLKVGSLPQGLCTLCYFCLRGSSSLSDYLSHS